MLDTRKGIGGFWQRYDPRFFARELPCDIDYQLAVPVPETLCGIDYLARYLESLWIENRFLRRFGAGELAPVLEKYSPDSRELLVNLFEPVFANALGLAVLGRSPAPLLLRRQELQALYAVFDRLPPREIEACLLQAARLLWAPDDAAQRYVRLCCTQLAPRIAVLRDVGGLSGVFQTEA